MTQALRFLALKGLGFSKNLTSKAAALVAILTVSIASQLSAAVVLPATGVDIPEFITAAVTALGIVLVAAVSAWVAFLIIRKGLRYMGKLG